MFGYVKTFSPELKMKDYDIYRAMYCSLCKTLGRRYGVFTRLFLNYDLAFLALTLSALSGDCPGFLKKRCDFNPAKKCNLTPGPTPALNLAADACVALTYYKMKDSLADSGAKQKAAALLALPCARAAMRKAKRLNPSLVSQIETYIRAQHEVEQASTPSVDRAAEPSALLLACIFSEGEQDPNQKRVRERFGYCLGRWVYLIDACDDFYDDARRGNYNPYVLTLGKAATPADLRAKMSGDLNQTAAEAARACDLLNLKRFHDIIENVICDGLFHTAESVLNIRFQSENSDES